jgi:hypothetical protein
MITEFPTGLYTPYIITTGPDGAFWPIQFEYPYIGRYSPAVLPPPVAANEAATTKGEYSREHRYYGRGKRRADPDRYCRYSGQRKRERILEHSDFHTR